MKIITILNYCKIEDLIYILLITKINRISIRLVQNLNLKTSGLRIILIRIFRCMEFQKRIFDKEKFIKGVEICTHQKSKIL